MENSKDIFIRAAKGNTVVHIGVHWELRMMNQLIFAPHIKKAWCNASSLGKILSEDVTSLWTTLSSSPAVPMGEKDRFVMHDNFSAIANQEHSNFLKEQSINVALISGITATKCVKETRDDCLKRGITPIIVTDATDVCGNPERVWGENCLVTTVEEVAKWMEELHPNKQLGAVPAPF